VRDRKIQVKGSSPWRAGRAVEKAIKSSSLVRLSLRLCGLCVRDRKIQVKGSSPWRAGRAVGKAIKRSSPWGAWET
jgi:hypothetical protein